MGGWMDGCGGEVIVEEGRINLKWNERVMLG